MSHYLNNWGCISFAKNTLPESQAKFSENRRSGVTMLCITELDDCLELVYKDEHYWVDKKAFCERPTPDFVWDEVVVISGKGIIGTVSEICWHYNEQQYFYHLISGGKKLKKRYYANELERYLGGHHELS